MPPRPTSPASPKRLPPELRQEQILDCALHLILREGYAAASMQAIAREAGVSRPVVYEFYADREDLILDLLDRENSKARDFASGLIPGLEPGASRKDAIRAALAGSLSIVAEAPDRWRLILLPPHGAPAAVRDQIEETRSDLVQETKANISSFNDPARTSELDEELLAVAFVSACEAAARLLLSNPDEFTPERITAVVESLGTTLGLG